MYVLPFALSAASYAGDAGVDALIVAGVVERERRLDLRRVLGARLAAVERRARTEILAQPHRQLIDDAAAEAEADRAELAVRLRTRLEPLGRRDEVFGHLRAVHVSERRRALLIVARVAADRRQAVRRVGDEVRRRRTGARRPRCTDSGRGSRG